MAVPGEKHLTHYTNMLSDTYLDEPDLEAQEYRLRLLHKVCREGPQPVSKRILLEKMFPDTTIDVWCSLVGLVYEPEEQPSSFVIFSVNPTLADQDEEEVELNMEGDILQ